jgi:hypothetical protein
MTPAVKSTMSLAEKPGGGIVGMVEPVEQGRSVVQPLAAFQRYFSLTSHLA